MTSENVNEEHLFYGNTTYIQFRIEYTTGPNEVYDHTTAPTTPMANGLGVNADFWSGLYNGERLIFDGDPSGISGVTDVKSYKGGVMYYKFPVRDPREIGTERQCCVIRNHYYEINVNNIFNLGEPDDEVDPEEPIDPTDTDVQIEVKVLEWFKVEQGEDL